MEPNLAQLDKTGRIYTHFWPVEKLHKGIVRYPSGKDFAGWLGMNLLHRKWLGRIFFIQHRVHHQERRDRAQTHHRRIVCRDLVHWPRHDGQCGFDVVAPFSMLAFAGVKYFGGDFYD